MVSDKPSADAIFLAAIEVQPGQRAAFLAEACGNDKELLARVERLLNAQSHVGSFLETPAPELGGTVDRSALEQPGTVIGPYKLLQQIGEGGMGVVFMAEQTDPLQRTVALKIIKPGMDTRQVIARFEAERQALAMMDHPNIARVIDAGTTGGGLEPAAQARAEGLLAGASGSGRPYFVMELVKGVPITDYCDQQHLPVRARLELFATVCHAVQHAHQKGIIHRDLKPSNVLVAEYDGRPVPKIIDFGVAKATAQRLTEKTMFTELGQMIGTVEYMSPEQARFNQLDVDTRSDIYSLGVLVYELLTGSTPFGRKRLNEAAFDEMLRIIREEEPPKPSTRLSSSDALPSIAASRGLEPLKLNRLVQGELDWIVMKALEKDRNRRYETASNLAADIGHYLNDEPVEACPPSAGYRLRKFSRRNKPVLLTATLVAAALIFGTVASTWQAIRASQAEAESGARAQEARQSEAQMQAVLEFVQNKVFAAARPEGQEGGLSRDVTLRQAVETALPFVEASFTDQPLIEARLRSTLGTSFKFLGEPGREAHQFQKARELFTRHLGPDHPDTLSSMHNLANSYASLGRLTDALKLHEVTLALVKAKFGRDHPNTLNSMLNLANAYAAVGQHADALKLREVTRELMTAKLGPDHPDTLVSMNNLAKSYAELGRHNEALKLDEETLALRKAKLGPDHPDTLNSMNNLAGDYRALGRYDEALKLGELTVAIMKAKLGAGHRYTLGSMDNLANAYHALGRHADAVKLREERLELLNDKLGPDHPETLISMNDLAWALATCPDPTARNLGRVIELAKKMVELAPEEGIFRNTLGIVHYRVGDWQAAIAALDKSMELREGGDSNDYFFLAMAHWQLGHKEDARQWYARAVEWMEKKNPSNEELLRFRAEAAKLLGITEPQSSTEPKSPEAETPNANKPNQVPSLNPKP